MAHLDDCDRVDGHPGDSTNVVLHAMTTVDANRSMVVD